MITGLGALQSVTFEGVGQSGADIHEVKFEKGSLDYRIWLGPGGKIETANVRPRLPKEPLWWKAFVRLSVGGYGTKIEGIKTEVGTIRDNATINASP
jgi:hypothetical protein